jgi:hypothetical protein
MFRAKACNCLCRVIHPGAVICSGLPRLRVVLRAGPSKPPLTPGVPMCVHCADWWAAHRPVRVVQREDLAHA